MTKPLARLKVIEVAMWAFVPAAGGMLADMGADVIKIEPPTGDPIRGLSIGQMAGSGFDYSWESYNRGKRSITLDLRQEAGLDVLHRLVADADIFLTNLLPPARRRMRIDADAIRALQPDIIYAVGSGVGHQGPESDRGGYDAISFWARGGISSSLTADEADFPVGPPGPAFGDTLSASMLAGGVAAAVAQRALTGHAATVDVSLLSAAMWSVQRPVSQAASEGLERFPRPTRQLPHNVLVGNYRTADSRFVALCMLQADRYWTGFCRAAGRADLAEDPRYVSAKLRVVNRDACLADLEALFAGKTLAEWREILARQEGQWDVVQHVGELKQDAQVQANRYLQPVTHADGRTIDLVSVPMQFDGEALSIRSAPQLGEHSDEILGDLGYDEEAIIDLKIAGVVF